DGNTLLTAGLGEGRLQLWRTPGEANRAYEVRQFVSRERSPVTCAAYSSYPGLGSAAPFVASGTQDGYVYLWALPTQLEVERHRVNNAQLKLVTNNQDPGGQI